MKKCHFFAENVRIGACFCHFDVIYLFSPTQNILMPSSAFLPFFADSPPSVFCFLFFAYCFLLSTFNFLLFTFYFLPSAFRVLLFVFCSALPMPSSPPSFSARRFSAEFPALRSLLALSRRVSFFMPLFYILSLLCSVLGTSNAEFPAFRFLLALSFPKFSRQFFNVIS